MSVGLVGCAAKPAAPKPPEAPSAQAAPATPGNCPKLVAITNSFLSVLDTFTQLDEVLQDESPGGPAPQSKNPCGAGVATCTEWARFDGDYARWEYTSVAGKVVAIGAPRAPENVDVTGDVLGHYVVGARRQQDYFCPEKPADDCYPYSSEETPPDEPEPMSCESDGRLRCIKDGERVEIQVLDVPRLAAYSAGELRHVKAWQPSLGEGGSFHLQVDGCQLEPPR